MNRECYTAHIPHDVRHPLDSRRVACDADDNDSHVFALGLIPDRALSMAFGYFPQPNERDTQCEQRRYADRDT